MNDMEKELKFYQQIILKHTNNSIKKEKLEEIISKELKTFTKKKFKHLNHEDVYKIVKELSSETNETSK